MKTLSPSTLESRSGAGLHAAALRPVGSGRVSGLARIAAPNRPAESLLSSLDKAEQARLEESDAFAELVEINTKRQSVNRPQKVSVCPQVTYHVGV